MKMNANVDVNIDDMNDEQTNDGQLVYNFSPVIDGELYGSAVPGRNYFFFFLSYIHSFIPFACYWKNCWQVIGVLWKRIWNSIRNIKYSQLFLYLNGL